MKLSVHTFELPLRHVFTISRESTRVQPTVIVELEHGGQRGFGEATTNPYYRATIEQMVSDLAGVVEAIEQHDPCEPEQLWHLLRPMLADNPFALCAVDQAAHDLAGKLEGRTVYQRWGLTIDSCPASNFTIGIDETDVMVAKLMEEPAWPIYKIKLGTDRDLEIVSRLREHTHARFRVDANCAWQVDEAIEKSQALKELGVEFIEQPLPAGDPGQQRLFRETALPLMADESCISVDDVARCHGAFHGVNIKLVKCGGLTPARMMIDQARDLGLQVMVGCMTESSVGISAIAQLLPLLDYVDMDGAALLAADVAQGVEVINGICHYPNRPGSGVVLLQEHRIELRRQ